MISVKTPEEIKILREGGKILASILSEVAREAAPGIATIELDALAEKLIRKAGGEPSFKNYKTAEDKIFYPASLCVSINDEVVHGIPSKRKLKYGDIVGLDLGMKYKNLYTDMAITVPVGKIRDEAKKIIKITKECLDAGVKAVKSGARIGDIGFVIQRCAEKNGFSVIRELVGHGVGYKAHEEPEIPNFGRIGDGEVLKEGMVLALEPMLAVGKPDIFLDNDSWTWKTKDGSLSAHFEHTIVVTKTGAEILTCLPAVDRRLMGIDYGEKRIGIAVSDEAGKFAFPYSVIKNCPECARLNLAQIKKICEKENIGKIIIGKSVNYKGEPNPIMKKIEHFKAFLEKEIGLPAVYQTETLTTKEAERLQGRVEKIDASAAALILRSFIEKENMLK